jgi:hypothetical protein
MGSSTRCPRFYIIGDNVELTNDEKINIVMQHVKTVSLNIYNLQVLLISEQAAEPVNEETVSNLNNKILAETSRMEALESELTRLKA